MGFPLILIGLVLEWNPGWFNGAHTIGAVCLWTGIILTVLHLLVFAFVFWAASS